jgi:hypothetical protein
MTKPTDPQPGDAAPLTITRHPPEHGAAGSPEVLPAGCCCCCCCCLHTLGGLVGAITGSISPVAPTPVRMDPDAPFPFRRDEFEDEGPVLPVTALYWLLVLFLISATAVWYYINQGATNPESLGVGLVIAFMILPALQLCASVLAFAAVGLFYPSRSTPLRRVGKITVWSFAGTLIGVALMGGCCGVLTLATRR